MSNDFYNAVLARYSTDALQLINAYVLVAAAVYLIIRYLNMTDIPQIKGLPEIPGVPVFGNLLTLGSYHHVACQKLAKKYGPVFQIRLGNKRVIFANTFDSVKDIWIGQQSAMVSRPALYTFHQVIGNEGKSIFECSSENYTVGSSPWDKSCRMRKKAIAAAMNKPRVQSYMPCVDLETTVALREMHEDNKGMDMDIKPYISRISLNMSLTVNYGLRIHGTVEDELLREILEVEKHMVYFRSTSNNWQDYIPLLRFLPRASSKAAEYRERRRKYLERLLETLKDMIAKGTDKPCISGTILKESENRGLNDAELRSIGASVVAGGLDTLPANLIMGIAYLSSPHGAEIQERAYKEIMDMYPAGDAWTRCLEGNKVDYIKWLTLEILRFWSTIPICLPRVNIDTVYWKGAVIPPGTTFLMNAYAANYDPTHFNDPYTFNPDRWASDSLRSGTPHYAFGAGLRACAGSHLANREIYVFLVRLIVAFRVVPPQDPKDFAILDSVRCNEKPTSLTIEPKPFKVGLRVRDEAKGHVESWMAESEKNTKHLL